MDITTILGIVIGLGGILAGNAVEGGHLEALLQGAAFVIVFFGTLGATVVSCRKSDLSLALSLLKRAFTADNDVEAKALVKEMMEYSRIAKKDTPLALEPKLPSIKNAYLRNALRGVVDSVDSKILEGVFQNQIQVEEEHLLQGAKVWSEAGGFAPTIGIIGAVLGLIHVMGNLADTSKLGTGIAVAFVATIYGVGLSNLVFIPIGSKIKRKIQTEMMVKRMILEGALGIQAGLNPLLLEVKLKAFLSSTYEH